MLISMNGSSPVYTTLDLAGAANYVNLVLGTAGASIRVDKVFATFGGSLFWEMYAGVATDIPGLVKISATHVGAAGVPVSWGPRILPAGKGLVLRRLAAVTAGLDITYNVL
jgi:hypothetical protein